jgi:hypothetical protein
VPLFALIRATLDAAKEDDERARAQAEHREVHFGLRRYPSNLL